MDRLYGRLYPRLESVRQLQCLFTTFGHEFTPRQGLRECACVLEVGEIARNTLLNLIDDDIQDNQVEPLKFRVPHRICVLRECLEDAFHNGDQFTITLSVDPLLRLAQHDIVNLFLKGIDVLHAEERLGKGRVTHVHALVHALNVIFEASWCILTCCCMRGASHDASREMLVGEK